MPFPPGHYYKDGKFTCYCDIAEVEEVCRDDLETVCKNIHDKLVAGIEKRLDADAPLGFLLSGGLDSSLVCSVAAKLLKKPIRTFAIGMSEDAIDLKYAREVADYIHSDHTEVIITKDDVIENLETVIALLGTYDITTVRASMGMYLVCKAIHEQTDVRVLLTGEISDELFGYKYTDFAPSAAAFQTEAQKRVRELHMYDVLRAAKYPFATPFTKESLLYREIFEKYYPGQAEMVKDFWMPNKAWEGCDVNDPSARVLANYGASGE